MYIIKVNKRRFFNKITMWYKTALQYNLFGTLNKGNKKSRTRYFADDEDENAEVNQQPNLDEPNLDEPNLEEPENQEPVLTPVPVQIDPVVNTPVGVENKTPLPINLPPGFIAPPVHEFCHCEIITLPGGRQVWRLGNGENHCEQCRANMQIFNQANQQAYGT
jgi:hypothetical protein